MDLRQIENEIDLLIGSGRVDAGTMRSHRRKFSALLKEESASEVLQLAIGLKDKSQGWRRFFAYELVKFHKSALASLTIKEVEALGEGIHDWGSVDMFGLYIAGQAWREGQISDEDVLRWARSPDRWWRRAALVATVPLNIKSQGGSGDVGRTLMVCEKLLDDRDDMVVKALSWALRELAKVDPRAVREFMAAHGDRVAARARREVRNKLETGKKNSRLPQNVESR